jgi:hemolysin III
MLVDRSQSPAEEFANSLTHGLGLLASIAALPVLVATASRKGGAWLVAAASVYGTSLVVLYTTSVLYHALTDARAKAIIRRCDHAAIYLLIAGTYSPFLLGPLRGPWGWSLLGVVWTCAVIGILFKAVFGIRMQHLSTTLYVLMGWLMAIAVVPLRRTVPLAGLAWLVAGGLFYTGGVLFYVLDRRMRFAHALWHLFVLAGSAAHFWAVLRYAIPGAVD